MAAPETVITVVKRFTYRGNANEEYSNTYMLSGTKPVDNTAWRALFDALVLEEKKLYDGAVQVIRGYGYDRVPSSGDSATWSVDLTVSPNAVVPGTISVAAVLCPGDAATWIRWGLDRLNSRGKRVYLRKYFHPALMSTGGTPDIVAPGWVTAANAFATKLHDGSFAGARQITDRLGTAVVGHAVGPYVTTRTLKRRGKRPPT